MRNTVILASHGNLAAGMQSAVELIAGRNDTLFAFGLGESDAPQQVSSAIEALMDRDHQQFYVILCDLKGGSVYNQLLQLTKRDNIALISGMHLGLVLEILFTKEDLSDKEVLKQIVSKSRRGVELFDYDEALSQSMKEENALW
jgi:mannose/fructose-specific phosphotransferase system component IIA